MLNPDEENGVRRLLRAQQQIDAQAQLDAIVKVHSQIYDKAVAYANIVMLGGYAALFASWGFASRFMGPNEIAVAGVLSLISALTFVFWEVYKGTIAGRAYSKVATLIAKEPMKAVPLLVEFEQKQAKRALMHARIWYPVIVICLVTALGAAGTIGYAFVSHLVSQTTWKVTAPTTHPAER